MFLSTEKDIKTSCQSSYKGYSWGKIVVLSRGKEKRKKRENMELKERSLTEIPIDVLTEILL